MDASRKETIKLVLSFVGSIFIASIALTLIASEFVPKLITITIIPFIAYLLSVIISVIYQYSACKTLSVGSIFVGDLGVLLTNVCVGGLLLFEDVPIFKYMFGPYAPRNPISALPYDPSSAEYVAAMANENHYKFQFFTGIVKAVLPVYFADELKNGFVYFYWTFWMTMLPLYFLMGLQGLC